MEKVTLQSTFLNQREGVFPYSDKNLSSETGSRTTEHKVYFRNKRYECSSQRSYLYHLNYILNWHMAEHVALPLCYIIVPVENKVVIPREGIPSSVHKICRDVQLHCCSPK